MPNTDKCRARLEREQHYSPVLRTTKYSVVLGNHLFVRFYIRGSAMGRGQERKLEESKEEMRHELSIQIVHSHSFM